MACRALHARRDQQTSSYIDVAVLLASTTMVVVSVALFASAKSFARHVITTPDKVLTAAFLFIALVLTGQCILYLTAPAPLALGEWRASVWGTLIQYTGLLGSIVLTFSVFIATSGHPFGDRVLARFSGLIRTEAGAQIFAARLGGEEFLLLLPATNLERAAAIAEEIRENFVAQRWAPFAPNSRFTASMGVTVMYPREPLANALKRADDLLYSAKRKGRNCVVAGEAADAPSHGLSTFRHEVSSEESHA